MATKKLLICPYCGHVQQETQSCSGCGTNLDAESRRDLNNSLGPWFVRDENAPHMPGRSYETIARLIDEGKIDRYTIVRGPTTRQLWTVAKRAPGIAHLVGYCHGCGTHVDRSDHGCHICDATFGAYMDRNYLGVPEVQGLPFEPNIEDDDQGAFHAHPGQPPGLISPAPGRLSSFASNDQLVEVPAQDVSPQSMPSAPPMAADTAGNDTTDDGTSPIDATTSLIEARAHARAIKRKRERTRNIIIGITLVVVTSAVFIVSQFLQSDDNENAAQQGDQQNTKQEASDDNAVLPTPESTFEQPDGLDLDGAMTDGDPPPLLADPASSETQATTDNAGGQTVAKQIEQYIDDIRALTRDADDTSIAAQERLVKYQKALDLVAEAQAVIGQLPDDEQESLQLINEMKKQIKDKHERLRLESFFG